MDKSALTLREDAILISLNSNDATLLNSTMLSNVVFNTNAVLAESLDIEYADIQLVSAQILSSFYVINSNNNTLNYTVSASNFTISLTSGNYNFDTFNSMIVALFATNGHIVTASLSPTTGLISFQFTGALQFNSSSTCGSILGFSSNVSSVANVLVMTFPMNITGPLKLKIMSNSLSTGNIDSSSPCLAVVPVNVAPFQVIMFDNTNGHKNLLRSQFINAIDIRITDQFGVLLDFNNAPWTITLRLGVWRWVVGKSSFRDVVDQINAAATA